MTKPTGLVVMYPNAVADVYGAALAAIAGRVELLAPPLSAEALALRPDLLARVDVIFSGWGAPVMDERFLEQAPRLRAVFYAAGSVRGWLTEAVWRRGIVVTTAAAANAVPVAEYTVAAILFSLKAGWRYALGAKRLGRHPPRVRCAGGFGARVGLVSLGLVARGVVERLRPTALTLIAHDPLVSSDEAGRLGVSLTSLIELFRECDVISVHTPLLPETRGLIGREHFAAMKPGATLINTARGEILREAELIDVLTARDDLTAVLDVTNPEPPPPGSPLYTLPNVVLTPHIAGSLDGECRRLGAAMAAELDRWLRGEPLQWQLQPEHASHLA
ncbi:MAG TPA: hydroxyacid dehydrogenase [Candidatus Synoicihabitans sp.]|nr:hydroxyacid dehydrogenase [Candidatus Synoicihabitans sp.]